MPQAQKRLIQLDNRHNFTGKKNQKDNMSAKEFSFCRSLSWICTCRKTCCSQRATLKPHARKSKGVKHKAND